MKFFKSRNNEKLVSLETRANRSTEYLNLQDSVGKEIDTGRTVNNDKGDFDVFFKLSKIDGEATFILKDKNQP